MKILYLNHVCWEWIMQRPQILALHLEKDFDCTVANKKFILGKQLAKDNQRPEKERIIWLLPKDDVPLISKINNFIYASTVKKMCNKYDAIWVCHPSLYKYIPENYSGKIIYDCMDDHVAMTSESQKGILKKQESELIKRSDKIFVTSEKLKHSVSGLENSIVVRNGYRKDIEPSEIKQKEYKNQYSIGYFGTVSSWFDFEALEDVINNNKDVIFHIIGPLENSIKHKANSPCEQLTFEGIVEHSNLGKYVESYDALIMPFVINDLILAVDPVKLYEYINLGKCIISVWYPEIDRFSPYVYFYRNKEELNELVGNLKNNGFPPKYNDEQQKIFLDQNTWETRYEVIKKEIKDLM